MIYPLCRDFEGISNEVYAIKCHTHPHLKETGARNGHSVSSGRRPSGTTASEGYAFYHTCRNDDHTDSPNFFCWPRSKLMTTLYPCTIANQLCYACASYKHMQ